MADFCPVCVSNWPIPILEKDVENFKQSIKSEKFYLAEASLDMDFRAMFAECKEGQHMGVLCEGCSIVAIGRFEDKCKIARMKDPWNKKEKPVWEDFDIDQTYEPKFTIIDPNKWGVNE